MGRHRGPLTGRLSRPWRAAALAGATAVITVALAAPALGLPGLAPHQEAPAGPGVVPGTVCTATAKACVDLDRGRAWLLKDGAVLRGPVPIRSGVRHFETPVGTFHVMWKDQNHVSSEYENSPMPYSVFFADGGVAFHEGSLDTGSAGCVRLQREDAITFFNTLRVGDEVQVH